MPNLHDIERRIGSVTSTKQITRTMEMVAAAKIRRATSRMDQSIPWASALSEALQRTAQSAPEALEALSSRHDEVKRVALVIMTSDRGLAGGFNSTILRYAEGIIRDNKRNGIETDVISCGKKGHGYLQYRGIETVLAFQNLSADPTFDEACEIAHYVYDAYMNGSIDKALLLFNHAKNSAEQRLVKETLLPIPEERLSVLLGLNHHGSHDSVADEFADKHHVDVEFEPDAETTMRYLLREFLSTEVYFALVDSAAAEQGARRSAMKSATDNANDMVETLTRLFNRERQGAITTEINEIVGGAAALED